MKILRLTSLLDFGGQEKQYISFTEKPELLHNNYVFVALGYGGFAEKIIRNRGFEVHILNRNVSIRNLLNILILYHLIRKLKPDVVHTAAAEANFHGILAAKLAGIKVICGEEIGIPNHSLIAQKVFAFIYKRADKIICVSKAVKDHLIKTKEIKKEKGEVVYNPVTFPQNYKKKNSDCFTLVFVGRLEKVKNVETLLFAFSKVHSRSIILNIVGDGHERKRLEFLAKELDVAERVCFKGFQKDPAEFIAQADLFVLPSYSEGFGIAVVEAMFQKVPVLCSNVGGIPEFVKDNENGWLFNPNNLDELIEKLNMIISLNKHERTKIGDKGYKEVKNRFTVKRYIEKIEHIYKNANQ